MPWPGVGPNSRLAPVATGQLYAQGQSVLSVQALAISFSLPFLTGFIHLGLANEECIKVF